MPLPALSLWPGRQPCMHRLVDDRIGGGPSSVAPRSRNPPTDLLITVFARPTPVPSRLRARQQSQSSPDPSGKDSATSSPISTEAGTSVRLSFQSRSLLLLADESSGVTVTKTSELASSLKTDRNLFSRLYVASQFRDGNLDELFSHENQPCPPSPSDRGKLKLDTKSDIVRCLEYAIEEQDDITPSVEVVVLDGHAIVRMLKPASAIHFREYAQDVFLAYVEHQLDKAQRVDVVWDDYRSDSLKAQTRDMRGK